MISFKGSSFYLKFEENYFNKGEIIETVDKQKLKVLQTPHKKWWRQLFQFITFGLYKAPIYYKVKINNYDKRNKKSTI